MTKSMRMEMGLLKIGEIARAAMVPVSTVRHYTDLGLIKVMHVTECGYRLYKKEDTLVIMNMIRIVKSGKSLNDIKGKFEYLEGAVN